MELQRTLSDVNAILTRCTDRMASCLAWVRMLREGRPADPEALAQEVERTAREVQRELVALYERFRFETLPPAKPGLPEVRLVEALFGNLDRLEAIVGTPDQPWALDPKLLEEVKDLLIRGRRNAVALNARAICAGKTSILVQDAGLPSAASLAGNKRGPHPISGPVTPARQPFPEEPASAPALATESAIRRAAQKLEEYRARTRRSSWEEPVSNETPPPAPPPPPAPRAAASESATALPVPLAPVRSATMLRRKSFE